MEEKQCSKCRRFLPRSSFFKENRASDGLRSDCKECVSARGKQYRKNPLVRKRKNQKVKEWHAKNSERGREIRRIAQAKWRASNLEKAKEATRMSMAKDRANNPDKFKVREANQRAKRMSIKGIVTEDEWVKLRDSCNGICPCCGQKIELEMDHINPICKGGPNLIENVQPLCQPCNSRKNRKTIRYI